MLVFSHLRKADAGTAILPQNDTLSRILMFKTQCWPNLEIETANAFSSFSPNLKIRMASIAWKCIVMREVERAFSFI